MKMDCRQIDELMMDYLYQELDAAQMAAYRSHLTGCPQCAAQLAVHERTRAAVRMLPELEPPSSVTAKLLEAAAQRAVAPVVAAVGAAGATDSVAGPPPGRAGGGGGRVAQVAAEAGDKKGLWAWLTGVFQPIAAHPGFAAAAGLVIVGSVAGLLAMRGAVSEKASAPSVASPAAEQARAELALAEKNAAPGAMGAPAAAAPAPVAVPQGQLIGDGTTVAPSDPAASVEGFYAQKNDEAAAGPRARLATPEEQGIIAAGRGGGGSADSLGGYGKTYGSSTRGAEADREQGGMASDDRAGGVVGGVASAPPPPAAGGEARPMEPLERAKDSKRAEATPAAPRAPVTMDAPKAEAKPSPAPAKKPTAAPKEAVAAGAPSADEDAAMEAPAPQAGATVAQRDGAEAEGRADTRKKQKVAASEQEARKLHGQARAKANTGDCASAMKLRDRIYRVDQGYFDRSVKHDDELNRCTTSGKKGAARKNTDMVESPSPSNDKAPAPTKPTDSSK